jgi:hypothetical protein
MSNDHLHESVQLQEYILAENVTVKREAQWNTYPDSNVLTIDFDFLCPNCACRHWGKEVSRWRFNVVSYALRCGWAKVRMPWADNTPRDEETVYTRRTL